MSKRQPISISGARAALSRFCQGKERMCVPARPDDDDMILAAALDELDRYRETAKLFKRDLPPAIEEIKRIEHCLESGTYLDHRDTAKAVKAFRLLMAENMDLRMKLDAAQERAAYWNGEHSRETERADRLQETINNGPDART